MAYVVDAADELGTVVFGYARCSHVAVDRYSHSSRAIDIDGRRSPLITADKLNSLEVCGYVAPLEPQLCTFNCCVDNYIMWVLHSPCQKRSGFLAKDDVHSSSSASVLTFLFVVTHGY